MSFIHGVSSDSQSSNSSLSTHDKPSEDLILNSQLVYEPSKEDPEISAELSYVAESFSKLSLFGKNNDSVTSEIHDHTQGNASDQSQDQIFEESFKSEEDPIRSSYDTEQDTEWQENQHTEISNEKSGVSINVGTHAYPENHYDSDFSVSDDEQNISLPSVEPSFAGSLLHNNSMPLTSSPTFVRLRNESQDQLVSNPSISPAPTSSLQDKDDLSEHFHSEYDEVPDYIEESPLLKKSSVQFSSRIFDQDKEPQTRRRVSNDPTETAIVSRVKNVNVTDSAVKHFKAFSGRGSGAGLRTSVESESVSSATTVPGIAVKSTNNTGTSIGKLTLKEQAALIDKLQKDNWGYQLKIYILQEELDKRSEDNVRDIRNENIEFKSINVGLNIEIKKLHRNIADLESKLRKSEIAYDDLQNRLFEQEKTNSSQHEIDVIQTELESVKIELHNTKLKLAKEQNDVRAALERELQLQDEINDLRRNQNNDLLEEEISALKQILEKEQQERESAQRDVLDLRNELLRARRSTSTLGDRDSSIESSRLRQENRELRRDLASHKTLVENNSNEKDYLLRELDELQRSIRRSSSAATSSRHSMTGASESDENVEDLKEKVAEARKIARDRKRQVDYLNHVNGNLQDELEKQRLTIESLGIDQESLTAEISELVKDIRERDDEIITWQEDYDILSNEANAEIIRYNDLVTAKEREFSKLNSEIESFSKLVSAFERESDNMKVEATEYREKISAQEGKIDELQRALDSAREDGELQLQKSQSDNERERERWNELKRRAHESEVKSRELMKKLEEANLALGKNAAISKQISYYEKAMAQLDAQLQELQRESAARADARSEWEKKATEYDTKIVLLEQKLSEAQDRNTALQQLTNGSVNSKISGGSVNSKSGSINGNINNLLSSTGSLSNASSGKWAIRLQELEQRLKAEREARVRERDGAKQRLDEAHQENGLLKDALSKARTARQPTTTFGTLGTLTGAFRFGNNLVIDERHSGLEETKVERLEDDDDVS
ncbi:hypothetical protein V1514DRAFT_25936 [Lipomyces japonicus]|uniref:uncharacterized protein n=1 Tax=Lipomyces japonicus TaxID=56871 RepID=UPI0034CD9A73